MCKSHATLGQVGCGRLMANESKRVMTISMSGFATYVAELDKFESRFSVISRKLVDASSQEFWTAADIWVTSKDEFNLLRKKLTSCNAPSELDPEHQRLISSYDDFLTSLELLVKSLNFDAKTRDEVLFNAGIGKMILAQERTLSALSDAIVKARG